MTLRANYLRNASSMMSACATSGIKLSSAKLGSRLGAIGGCGGGRRNRAYFREEGRAFRGGVQKTTERGPDKRPQGAARSVGCFCWGFSLIRQCVAFARNVRAASNALPEFSFPHIVGGGHG
jgi:hypothetical protein